MYEIAMGHMMYESFFDNTFITGIQPWPREQVVHHIRIEFI